MVRDQNRANGSSGVHERHRGPASASKIGASIVYRGAATDHQRHAPIARTQLRLRRRSGGHRGRRQRRCGGGDRHARAGDAGIYDDRQGLYAGAAIRRIARADPDANISAYYSHELTMRDILFDHKVRPTWLAAELAQRSINPRKRSRTSAKSCLPLQSESHRAKNQRQNVRQTRSMARLSRSESHRA